MKKTFKHFPARPEVEIVFRAERPKAALDVAIPAAGRRQYRRSPFYLKIEGLDGPRPKYDEFGRIVDSAVEN